MSDKSIGYIYLITNKVNGKMYVGQTSKTPEYRFKLHVEDSYKSDRYNSILHKAIRKYGEHNFKIDTLEECSIAELNDKEIYWITKLDTFNSGYNMTLGGEGSNRLTLPDEQELRDMCCKYTINDVARYYGVYLKTLRSWIEKYEISDIKTCKKKVACNINDKEYKFDSVSDAARWVINNKITNNKQGKKSVAYFISKSIYENKKYLGIKWYFI